MRKLLLALLLLGSPACTVDDSIIEGKHCSPGSVSDPDKTCMTGYECKCEFGECLCVKIDSLRVLPPEPRLSGPVGPTAAAPITELDPSRSLLLRLGLTPP